MFQFFSSLLLVLFCSGCGTLHPEAKGQTSTQAIQGNQMACLVKARVKNILPPNKSDSGTVCANHNCRAMIEIIAVTSTSGTFTMNVGVGEVVPVRFMFTMEDTRKVFPDMKINFPGLKKGSVFTAALHQRLKMGTEGELVIEDYQLVR